MLEGQGQSNFQLPSVSGTAPSFEGIMKMLSSSRATQSQQLPQLQQLLSGRSEFFEPQAQNISADIQGAMGKRGLTGSSIEAQAIGQGVGSARSQFALGGANTFAQMMQSAQAGDVNAQREMMMAISQAMGEEMTAQRQMDMFREQLQANMSQASQNRKSGMWGSIIGAAGTMAGGALGGPMGGMLGNKLGSMMGGTVENG